MNDELLLRYLRLYCYAPSLGYWRSFEAERIRGLRLEEPILDLGVGDGSFCHSLGLQARVTGIDISRRALRRMRRFWPVERVAQASACQLPFADGSFKTVLSNCVLEHIPAIGVALDEMCRVLAVDGAAVISVPGEMADRWGEGRRGFGRYRARVGHRNVWTADQWARELARRGLRSETVSPYMSRAEYDRFLDLDMLLNRPLAGRLLSGAMLAAGLSGLRGPLARRLAKRLSPERAIAPSPEGAGLFIVARKGRSAV
ncbi:MAG TPA: class I SAM-dependent methyltransferase [Candidatus Brocadiia bacterium]|nr:class I SAM-dependent methyltransferase [Candidatus Brocadiia bacterium]